MTDLCFSCISDYDESQVITLMAIFEGEKRALISFLSPLSTFSPCACASCESISQLVSYMCTCAVLSFYSTAEIGAIIKLTVRIYINCRGPQCSIIAFSEAILSRSFAQVGRTRSWRSIRRWREGAGSVDDLNFLSPPAPVLCGTSMSNRVHLVDHHPVLGVMCSTTRSRLLT